MPQKVRLTLDDGSKVVLTLDDDAPGPSAVPNAGLALQGGAQIPRGLAALARGAQAPSFPSAVGAITRGGTTLGQIAHGAYTGNANEIIMSPLAGWSAGKGGYWLGRGIQSAAAPIGRAAEAIAPYAQTLNTLSGAQGVNDLAQMAEPARQDIGFLGVGPTVNVPGAHPPLLNAAAQRLVELLRGGGQ